MGWYIIMQNGYMTYLFYIFLIACFFVVVVALVMGRFKKRNIKTIKQQVINSGNVGIFFDREKNVTIVPYVKDKYGMGRATGDLIQLSFPYQGENLGKATREAMTLFGNATPCTDGELMSKLGFRGWKEFSEGKRNISVHYKDGHGIVFNTTRRRVDGSYQFNKMGFEEVVDNNISNRELGDLLLVLLQRCR